MKRRMKKKPVNQTIAEVLSQMIQVPEGRIRLRDDRIKTWWEVGISSFFISRYPVTQDLYLALTGKAPSTFRGGRRPVESVSWTEAVFFCNKLSELAGFQTCYAMETETGGIRIGEKSNGCRLPSEAEWEYACKAGNREPRYGDLDAIGWYRNNSGGTTRPVGLKMANDWGICDMLGNVWEWCNDAYDEKEYGSYRIFRGGGWNDDERGCLATNRRRSHPSAFKIDDLGFRLVRNTEI